MTLREKKKTIVVRINFFGPYIKREEIAKILDPKFKNIIYNLQRDLLKAFFDLPLSALSPEILDRYVEVTTKDLILPIAPSTKKIFGRLLKPLKSAKKSYCLGDYLSTIASCGVVGEMLAILLWKINDVKLKGKPITEKQEKGLFNSTFEKLGQKRRLDILNTFGHIKETQYNSFISIKNIRRPYLHLWSVNLHNEKKDALITLKKTLQLFKEITGIGLADAGTVKVNPLLLKLFQETERKKLIKK